MPGMKFAKGDFGRNWGGVNSAMFFNNTTLDGVENLAAGLPWAVN